MRHLRHHSHIRFNFQHFSKGIILTATSGGDNFICLEFRENRGQFINDCQEFLDYSFGWGSLPPQWQKIKSSDRADCDQIQYQIASAIVNVSRQHKSA